MSKSWVVFLFASWTVALLVCVPFIFSFSVHRQLTSISFDLRPFAAPVTMKIMERRPLLDWTGRLAHRTVLISWGDKRVELPWFSEPYRVSGKADGRMTITTPENVVIEVP